MDSNAIRYELGSTSINIFYHISIFPYHSQS